MTEVGVHYLNAERQETLVVFMGADCMPVVVASFSWVYYPDRRANKPVHQRRVFYLKDEFARVFMLKYKPVLDMTVNCRFDMSSAWR